VSIRITIAASDPRALLNDVPFVCAFRGAVAELVAVPLASVQVVGAVSDAQVPFPILARQDDRACVARQLSDAGGPADRRAQSLARVTLEVLVDAAASTHPTSAAGREATVRAEVEAAFTRDPSRLDGLFSAVTIAACAVQGIALHVCPNSSTIVTLPVQDPRTAPEKDSTSQATGSVVVAGVSGGFGVAVIVAAVMTGLWWRERTKRERQAEKAAAAAGAGLVVRHIGPPPAQPAPRGLHPDVVPGSFAFHNPSYSGRSKRFEVRTVFDPASAAAGAELGVRHTGLPPEPPASQGLHPRPDAVPGALALHSGRSKRFDVRAVFEPSGQM
jgi:hypothetical protein